MLALTLLRLNTIPLSLILHVVPMFGHQIIIAVLVFNDKMTWFNIVGLGWAITGSILYKVARAKPNTYAGDGDAGKDET